MLAIFKSSAHILAGIVTNSCRIIYIYEPSPIMEYYKHSLKDAQMPETTKSNDIEPVSFIVNNRVYTRMMHTDEALTYKEKQRLVGKVAPEVCGKFEGLIEELGTAYANLGVPTIIKERFIGNQKALYEDFVKPNIDAKLWEICRTHIKQDSANMEKTENEANELKERIGASIDETKKRIEGGKMGFHNTAIVSYEKLKKSIAEILGISIY